LYGPIKKILIVGGGTSGWMTACLLSKRLDNVEITLIESSDIPTVGVGEATIIHMNYFLREMGLKERDWMPSCNATYKEGIYFENFYKKGAHYWHPFQQVNLEVTNYWIHKYYQEHLEEKCCGYRLVRRFYRTIGIYRNRIGTTGSGHSFPVFEKSLLQQISLPAALQHQDATY